MSEVYKIKTVSETITLKNISLKINKGEFVCIIGDVGSGKSSFLSSLIGDLCYIDNEFKKDIGENSAIDDKIYKQLIENS